MKQIFNGVFPVMLLSLLITLSKTTEATNIYLGSVGGLNSISGKITSSDRINSQGIYYEGTGVYISPSWLQYASFADIYTFRAAASGTAYITSFTTSHPKGDGHVSIYVYAFRKETDFYTPYTNESGVIPVTKGEDYYIRVSSALALNQTYSLNLTLPSVPVVHYTVKFNPNGGSISPSTRSIKKGSTIGELPIPTRSGYTFDGWYTAANGGAKISSSQIINGDVTYYAHWTVKNILSLTPTFFSEYNFDGRRATGFFEVTCNSPWKASASDSWITVSNQSGAGNGKVYYSIDGNKGSSPREGYITLKSGALTAVFRIWQAGYFSEITISWHANGGIIGNGEEIYVEKTYSSGLGPYLYAPLAPFYYSFIGWYTDPIGGVRVTEGMRFADILKDGELSVTLYAHYRHNKLIEIPSDKFEIFDCSDKNPNLGSRSIPFVAAAIEKESEGFSFVSAKTGVYKIFVKLIGEDYDDDFDSFLYARLYNDSTGEFVHEFSRMSQNRCFLNQGESYRLAIYRQKGTGTKPDLVAAPYLVQVGGEEVAFSYLDKPNILLLRDGVLAWSAIPAAEEYMVYQYEEPPPGKTGRGSWRYVGKTASIYYQDDLIKEDGLFCVRAVNSENKSVLSDIASIGTISSSCCLVKFDVNGGSLAECIQVTNMNKAIGLLPIPVRDKYTFIGWFTAQRGGVKISSSTMVTGDVTYYAQWVYNGSSTISAHIADGCESMGQVVGGKTAKGGTKVTLNATANKGYVFSHWEGPLGDVADSRSPSIAYVVGEEDVQFTAHFVDVNDDVAAISFEMADEYAADDVIVPVVIDVTECTSLPTVKVSGLPAGLKFAAKDIFKKGSNEDIEYPANTIYGTPTKSGIYTVVATVTTAGKKTATCSQVIVVRKFDEKIVIPLVNSDVGEVNGGGVYDTGKTATLKAIAKKGFVFAGWYEDKGFIMPCDSSVTDYRNPSYTYTMGEADKTLYARFELGDSDTKLGLTVDGVAVVQGENPLKSFVVGSATNIPLTVESLSLPKIVVRGLPAGLKFTDKPIYKKGSKTEIETPASSIYGTPSKPGVYKVSVSLTNTSIKKALVNDFEMVVPNLTDALIALEDSYGPYVPGVAYTNTIAVASGCTVSGLPAGMKWTAKDVVDSRTKEVVVPANTVYGAPTVPGKYTVYFTKTVDKVKHTATATFVVGDFPVVNVANVGTGTGKVSGTGAFAANKKVTLRATADMRDDAKTGAKKSVFAGWYYDAGALNPVVSSVDYRTVSLSYVMTVEPQTTLYAMFVTVEEDSDILLFVKGEEITADPTENNFDADGATVFAFELESFSIPKATVTGLPAGMKYTDKALKVKATATEDAYDVPANSIYGTPTKPGIYTVTVKLSNTTIKKAIEKKFTIEVPNLTGANAYFAADLNNGKKCVLSVGISNINDFLPDLRLNSSAAKLAVSGLPAGLKYDAKTGKITGVATKAGTYTVTLTVTDGKEKYVSTITIEVEALPDWVVGTFEGYLSVASTQYGYWDFHDHVILTIGANGKVICKGQVEDTSWYTYKGMSLISSGDGAFELYGEEADDDYSDIRCWRIEPAMVDGVTYGRIEGDVLIREYEEWDGIWFIYEGSAELSQNVWEKAKGTNLIPGFVKDARVAFDMSGMEDSEGYDIIKYDGCLTLKFGNKGVVTTAYSEYEGGKATATGSAQLVPYEVDGNITKAWLYTALKPKGRDPFGVLLFLEIDTSNGVVTGDDVDVVDYLLEVDE